MGRQYLYALIFLLIFSMLIFFTHVLHNTFKVRSEVSRKFIHVSGGILTLFFFHYFTSHWLVLMLCCVALILLIFTFLKDQLPGIHKTKRISYGSLFFPIPVYICFFAALQFNNALLFYLPISVLTFSDTAAEWGGRKWGNNSISFFNKQKTLAGSACFAVSAFIVSIVWLFIFKDHFSKSLLISVAIAVIVSAIELISLNGFDNITVPFSVLGLLMLFL